MTCRIGIFICIFKPSEKLHVDLKENSANFDQFWYFKTLINFHTWRYWLKILINTNAFFFKTHCKHVHFKYLKTLIYFDTWKCCLKLVQSFLSEFRIGTLLKTDKNRYFWQNKDQNWSLIFEIIFRLRNWIFKKKIEQL